MAAMAMTHTNHAVKSAAAGFTASSMTDPLHCARVAFAKSSGTLAVNATAFAVNAAALPMSVLCMNVLTVGVLSISILGMQRSLVRAMRIAHDSAEVKPVVVGNFAPTFPSLVHCYDVVEALARCISQQVGILQFTITEPSRRPFGLQRIDGNAGFVGNSRQHRSARRNGAE